MKLKNKTTEYSISGNTDKKSKLNKFNKKIDQKYLDLIEYGVTIEELDEMKSNGMPILKYQTQITIHGIFPKLNNHYSFGYKNIFQNKNKSIGIKYNAIDETKRREIHDKTKLLGWKYNRNSSEFNFELVKVTDDKNKIKSKVDELKKIADKIDETLFYGGKKIYIGQLWGRYYIVLDVYIGAIYQDNIDAVINQMGATSEAISKIKKQREQESLEREKSYREKRREEKQKELDVYDNHKEEIDLLKEKYTKVYKSTELGVYVSPTYSSWNEKLVFTNSYLYMPKGKKKPRLNRREFDTLNEALNHKPEHGFSDRIYGGRITGYKIN